MKRRAAVAFVYGCVLVGQCHATESVSVNQRKIPPPPPPVRSSANSDKEETANTSKEKEGKEVSKDSNAHFSGSKETSGRIKPPPPPPQRQFNIGTEASIGPSAEVQRGNSEDKRILYTPLETKKSPPPPPPKNVVQTSTTAPGDAKQIEPRQEGFGRILPLPLPQQNQDVSQDSKSRFDESMSRHAKMPSLPQRPPPLAKKNGDGDGPDTAFTGPSKDSDTGPKREPEDWKGHQRFENQPQSKDDARRFQDSQEWQFAGTISPPSMAEMPAKSTKQSDVEEGAKREEMYEDKAGHTYKPDPPGYRTDLGTSRPGSLQYDPSRLPPNDNQDLITPNTRFGRTPRPPVPPPGSGFPEGRRETIERRHPANVPPPGYQGQRPPPQNPQHGHVQNRPKTRPPPSRIDPREMHRRASAGRTEAAAPPTWKRLWRRIEGSLDGLADLEDKIGGKAKQLYSSTLDSAAATLKTPPFLNSLSKPPAKQQNTRWSRQDNVPQRNPEGPSLAERVSRKSDPQFAAKMSAASSNAYSTKQSLEIQSQRQPESRAINWDDVMHKKTRKVIRANGGASQPSDGVSKTTNPDPSRQTEPSTTSPLYPTSTEKPQATMKQAFPQSASQVASAYRPPRTPTKPAPIDDDSVGWKEKIGGLIPSFPRFRFRGSSLNDFSTTIDAWKAEDDASVQARRGFLRFFSRRVNLDFPPGTHSDRSKDHSLAIKKTPSTLIGLGGKCNTNRPFSLLNKKDQHDCESIGRSLAFWDMSTLLFFLVGIRTLPAINSSASVGQSAAVYAEIAFKFVGDCMETWALFSLSAALLSSFTQKLTYEKRAKKLASLRRDAIGDEVRYGRLFLRLFTSESTPKSTIGYVSDAAYDQVQAKVQLARLRSLTSFVILTIAFVAIRFVQPLFYAIGTALFQILDMKEIRQWPPEWKLVWQTLKDASAPLLQMIVSMMNDGTRALKGNPLRFAYETSIAFSLFTACLLPSLEAKRKARSTKTEEDEDEAIAENYERFTNHVSAMGTSSSSRLTVLSESVEGILERWRLARPPDMDESAGMSLRTAVRMCTYGLVGSAILLIPVIVYSHTGISPTFGQNQIIQWDSLFELAVVLYYIQNILWNTLGKVFKAKSAESLIVGFLDSIRVALEERKKHLDPPPMGLQLQAAISPVAGLNVLDLWAAHTTKRAWVVRGATFACRSGEVMLILGDESAGKSRLLATVAESFLSPPRGAATVTRVNRGSITLGGLDVAKWDGSSLRKRVGVILNDVRTCSDKAKILSGLTMEEILEPFDGLRSVDPSHSPTLSERACITQALHITGLNASLLPRLPSKMSTVVTANEEDLKPSHFRARSVVLSPVEWSKVLLARVLSQTIFDNDSTSHNSDKFENCLLGSVLLLDDVTSGLSEIDEARLLKNLRQTGAAVVVTSNRWAAGRWADKIVVVRDGVIVESGTHAELLTRGAQKSLYASNWHAMTSMT
eukprot:scaffold4833_cov233-Amphora_coffeaeformis.AAC.12